MKFLNATFFMFTALIIVASIYYEKLDVKHVYRKFKRDTFDIGYAIRNKSSACPKDGIVFAVFGQSNAANHVGTPVPGNALIPAFSFFRGRCYILADPIPGSSGKGGSLWTAFAQRLSTDSKRPVVVIAGAEAGTTAADWLDSGRGHARRAAAVVADAMRQGLSPAFAIWIQGESDAAKNTSEELYQKQLADIVRIIGHDDMHWFIALATLCHSGVQSDAIRRAQKSLSVAVSNVTVGPDLDQLGDTYRSDGCHFNDRGRERIVAMLLSILKANGRLTSTDFGQS